jgi:RNA polymerase sigma factor (sigma-70 family)
MESTRSSLLLRLRDRADQASWEEFFALYEPFLRNVARKAGLGEADVEDVAAEVLAKCVQMLPTFELDHEKSFRAWLKTVVRSKVYDLWRKRRGGADLADVREPETWDSLWNNWERSHQLRVLDFALAEVQKTAAANTWSCFDEHLRKGRPASEVGAELGLAVNAVYTNASRILKRVREICAVYDEDLIHA